MVVKGDLTDLKYTTYDFILTDLTDSIKDVPLVIAAYINDGSANKYVQSRGISDTVKGISYNEAKSSTGNVTVDKGTVDVDITDTLF